MKVKTLKEGELYKIDEGNRIVTVHTQYQGHNFLEIVRVSWDANTTLLYSQTTNKEDHLKGSPALYCGTNKVPSIHFKQGWWKSYKFLINGKYYNIAGYHVRHIWPIKKNLNK